MTVSSEPHSWDYYVTRYKEASDLQGQLQNDVSGIESGNLNQIASAYYDLIALIAKNSIWADLFTPGSPAVARLAAINQSTKTYLQGITLHVEDPNNPGQYINLYEGNTYYDSHGAIQTNYTGSSAADGHPPANLYDIITGACGSLFIDPNAGYIPDGDSNNADWSQSGKLNFQSQDKTVTHYIPPGPGGVPSTVTVTVGTYNSACGSPQDWAQYIHFQGADPTALNNALNA